MAENRKGAINSFADEEDEDNSYLAFVSSPSERTKAFFMKSNIIKNVLFSLALHGLALACCFAVPAQKLIPLLQAGNSSLTLTSLSISTPDKEQSAADQPAADHKTTLEIESKNQDALPDEPEMEPVTEDDPDDFPAIPAKQPPAKTAPKPQNQKMPIDADPQIKGIAGGRAGNSAIRPYYPLGARLRGEEGVVKVEVCIGNNGHALNCAVVKSSGSLALDDAALTAVKRARFVTASGSTPAKNSKTVLTFRFDLLD